MWLDSASAMMRPCSALSLVTSWVLYPPQLMTRAGLTSPVDEPTAEGLGGGRCLCRVYV